MGWTLEQVLAAVEWHHVTPVAIGGTNAWTNLVPLLAEDHRKETRNRTVPMIAKGKRIARAQGEHKARMAAKVGLPPETGVPVPAIDFGDAFGAQKTERKEKKRKLSGPGFRGSRRFDGTVRWKKTKRTDSRSE